MVFDQGFVKVKSTDEVPASFPKLPTTRILKAEQVCIVSSLITRFSHGCFLQNLH